MNTTAATPSHPRRSKLFAGLLAGALALQGLPAAASLTDLSSTPLQGTSAAQVKPNIMLLMDASKSTGWGHMPDEVETVTGIGSVGYKNSSCNVLYYNPSQRYTLPKRADGTFFTLPDNVTAYSVATFNRAPYTGYLQYYTAPDANDSSSVNLATSFKAFDTKTLFVTYQDDTPQPAYYYAYTGTQTLNYATAPCTDSDTGGSRTATGGGSWTKVIVGATSGTGATDERLNFTIWYSFYRTRMSLTKSAASLAFTPLTDSFRVGFITVEPKDSPSAPAINPNRYVEIKDFDITQRGLWFGKLFSQSPFGASPAREGLARVGRHYAGMHDGINTGMTGDPMLYSCQQNFTIMTTDGYWNAQTETPTNGTTYGGPLQIDGITKVGQQDGDAPAPEVSCPLSDPYCPRPIYDGVFGSNHIDTDVATLYSDQACGIPVMLSSRYYINADRRQLLTHQTATTQRTQFYNLSSSQDMANTTQMTATRSQVLKTTDQYVTATTTYVEDRYQVKKTTDQTTLRTEQWNTQRTQYNVQTSQVKRTRDTYTSSSTQFRSTTKQFVSTTTQFAQKVDQYKQGQVQVYKHVYQTLAYDSAREQQDALSGNCVQAGTVTCSTNEIFGPAAVDPSSCIQGVGPSPRYEKTDCTNGPMAYATAPVASCAPGTTSSGAPNYTVTTCTFSNTTPQAAVASCTPGTVTGAAPNYYVTTCSNPSGANNQSTAVSSCTLGTTPGTSPNWVTTVCSNPAGSTNQSTFVSSCTVGTVPGTSPNWTSVTCDKPAASNFGPAVGAMCTPGFVTGTSPNWLSTTCVKNNVSATPITPASCSVVPGTSPSWIYQTCPSAPFGAYATPAVDSSGSCSSIGQTVSGGPSYTVQDCSAGANYDAAPVAAPACTVGTTAPNGGNTYTRTVCTKPTDTTAFSAPCTSNPGTASPYVKTTCTGPTVLTGPTAVDPATCPIGTVVGAGPGFIRTTCARNSLSLVGGVCVAGNTGAPLWIQTDCNPAYGGGPVAFCNVGTTTVGNVTTVCTRNLNTAYAATCANSPSVTPNYTLTTCNPQTPVTAAVDPTTCVSGVGPAPAYVTTSCSSEVPAGPYVAPTAVASCTAGVGPSPTFYRTYCANPPLTNFSKNVLSCVPGTVPKSSPAYITTTCVYNDSGPVPQPGPAPTYCAEQVSASPSFTTKTCTTVDVIPANTPVGSCTGGPSVPQCGLTGVQATTTVPACPASPGPGPNFYMYTCTNTTPTAPVVDPTCVDGPGPAPGYEITSCTPGSGNGFLRVKQTTTTVTTTPYSGTIQTGPAVAVPTPGPVSQVDGVCYAAPLPFPNPNPQTLPRVSTVDARPGGSHNSLADVSQYYYKTDLRPDNVAFPNDVKAISNGPEDDRAQHQHMTTFTLALGVSGTLNYRPDYKSAATGDFADIRSGAKSWPVWPDPAIDYTSTPAMAANYEDKRSIDDFWHTAVNGRGTYFSATNPNSVIAGLSGALAGIQAALASSTGQGVSSLQPTAGNNFIYTATYTTGKWTGDVVASTINLTDGTIDTPPLWSAKTLLNGKVRAQCDNRNIYLARAGATNGMVPFTWNTDTCVAGAPSGSLDTQLNTTEQAYFGTTYVSLLSQYPSMTDGTLGTVNQRAAAVGDKLVNYVRGQRGYEPFVTDQLTTLYRQRDAVLGDVVDSQPVFVQAPFASYTDTGYDAFRAANLGRTPMVYVGANDGMLHAFYAGTSTTDVNKGQEAWAIIPSTVLPNLFKLADDNYANVHQFFVDGTPTLGDVYDSGSSSWKTILVNGLNDGGKAYIAVDVTDPAAPKTLWEFKWNPAVCPATASLAVGNTQDCHIGYTFGKPIITKLTNGTWVALVTSGYNNVNSPTQAGDGVGYLYVLNAMTGAIISKISTGVGDATNPAGLAQINNYVDNVVVNNTTVRAYGGDLLGYIWRFDINGTPAVTLLGRATDVISSNPQPITTRPELAELNNKPMVLVGTGSLLGATDLANSQSQSIYGITDPLTVAPVYPTPLRSALRPLQLIQSGTVPNLTRTVQCRTTATPAQCALTAGWVIDLPDAGERVNVDMKLALGTLIVATNVPQDSACSSGGYSWINYFNFNTGLAVGNTPGQVVSQYLTNSLVVGLGVIALPPQPGFNNPRYVGEVQFGRGNGGQFTPPIVTQAPAGKRVSWREIAQ